MLAAGWKYEVVDPVQQDLGGAGSDEEFSSQWGYGYTFQVELGDSTAEEPRLQDPNAEYIETLSEGERQQYEKDLGGDPATWPTERTSDGNLVASPTPGQLGCRGAASDKVLGTSIARSAGFSDRLDELVLESRGNPELIDASGRWAKCIKSDSDWSLSNPDDIRLQFRVSIAELQGLKRVDVDSITLQPVNGDQNLAFAFVSPSGEAFGYAGEPSVISEQELERLRVKEVKLWRADQKCQSTSGYAEVKKLIDDQIAQTLMAEFSGGN